MFCFTIQHIKWKYTLKSLKQINTNVCKWWISRLDYLKAENKQVWWSGCCNMTKQEQSTQPGIPLMKQFLLLSAPIHVEISLPICEEWIIEPQIEHVMPIYGSEKANEAWFSYEHDEPLISILHLQPCTKRIFNVQYHFSTIVPFLHFYLRTCFILINVPAKRKCSWSTLVNP